MIKNYGLKFTEPELRDPNAYILGGLVSLPKIVLQEDGQWDDYLPITEYQAPNYETFACTCYGTTSILEILLKKIEGKEYNFAERYPYNIAEIEPPGADPHVIANILKDNGLVNQIELPMPDTLEEYKSPRPMTAQYLVKGNLFPYKIGHEFVFKRSDSQEVKIINMKECLNYSPLGVSVTAWQEQDGVYVDNDQPNTHWTIIYGWNDKGWKCFDSYPPYHKIVSFDHHIEVAKRYTLVKKTPSKNYWFVDIIKRIFGL